MRLPYAYFDRWTARPGERLSLHVSSGTAFETSVVRIVQADGGPHGPGRKHEPQDWYGTAAHEAHVQTVEPGSWAESGRLDMLAEAASIELEIVFSPEPHRRRHGSVRRRTVDPDRPLRSGDRPRPEWMAGAAPRVRRARCANWSPRDQDRFAGRWYRARAALDIDRSSAELSVLSATPAPCGDQRFDLSVALSSAELEHLAGNGAPDHLVLTAARHAGTAAGADPPAGAGAAGAPPGRSTASSRRRSSPAGREVTKTGRRHFRYAWRLGQGAHSSEIPDTSTEQVPLRLVNAPAAAVTGHSFDGTVLDFTKAPDHYDTLAFHDDDLEDAGWSPTCAVELPGSLRSGVYAVVVSNASGSRHVPFFVVPAPGQRRAKIAVLMASFTYLAYANEHVREEVGHFEGVPNVPSPQDLEMAEHREVRALPLRPPSGRDGCLLLVERRPVINFDPTYRFWLFDGPVHLGEDIYLIDWLERLGYEYDILTDHELDAEGARALADYRVVITGSHPEYVSLSILDALEGHVHLGGRLMYLGGNGHYWVTSVDPRRPHLIEIRRGNSGGRTWESAPGEGYHSTTGEPGGLWRHPGARRTACSGSASARRAQMPGRRGTRRCSATRRKRSGVSCSRASRTPTDRRVRPSPRRGCGQRDQQGRRDPGHPV